MQFFWPHSVYARASTYIILLFMTYASIFSARIVKIGNSFPNPIVDASTINAFKARLDKFWSHQAVKYDLQLTWPEPETDEKL